MKTVSPGHGPDTSSPCARARSIAGAMIRASSSPNMPPSPACGLRPATPMRTASSPKAGPIDAAARIARSSASRSSESIASRNDTCTDTSTTRSSGL